MVHFRKALLVLAVMAFMASLASAQLINPLQCVANSGVPPIARYEGLAEEVGQVVITCTGGSPTAAGANIPTINVQIFLSVSITSRLLAAGSSQTEALLMIDEPAPAVQQLYVPVVGSCSSTTIGAQGDGNYAGGVGACRPNMFLGQLASTQSIVWLGVPFDPPGSQRNRVLRLANIRANANGAGLSTLIPSSITMFISISGTGSLSLSNSTLTVAYVLPGMTFSTSAGAFNQCDATSTKSFQLKYKESFGTAFRVRASAGDQNVPGAIYNTESMFSNATVLGAVAGVATQGTQLIARFANVPANIGLTVATAATNTDGDAVALVPGAAGSTTDATGKVTLTAGAGAAVWEVTAANPGAISTVAITVNVIYGASPLPGIGTATVFGNFAPTSAVTTAILSPAPRFILNEQSAASLTINPCRTNLLFPYVTNYPGFDTGIAISNTSEDPFFVLSGVAAATGTTALNIGTPTSTPTAKQAGKCTLKFYGLKTDGTKVADVVTATDVTTDVPFGFTLSNGGNYGTVGTSAATFTGYVIAQCNFQYAHGFAYVSDPGAKNIAMGYLALVMDNNFTATRTANLGETLNQ